MRLTPVRASLIALVVALVGAPLAFNAPALIAQDHGETEAGAEQPIPRSQDEIYADLSLFGEVFDRIRSEYVEPPDERELIHAAIQGMLSSLDPHSGYLEPIDYADVQENTTGQFGGLGIEVTMEEGIIKVVSPIDETPAAKSGILSRDYIIELDGQQVLCLTLDEAVSKMRGPIRCKIKLTVIRAGSNDPIALELARDLIAMRAVRWSLEGDIGVMRLSRFSEQAYVGIQRAIEDMYAEREGEAPKGLILDLRNNPGGLVDQAVYVTDAFL